MAGESRAARISARAEVCGTTLGRKGRGLRSRKRQRDGSTDLAGVTTSGGGVPSAWGRVVCEREGPYMVHKKTPLSSRGHYMWPFSLKYDLLPAPKKGPKRSKRLRSGSSNRGHD